MEKMNKKFNGILKELVLGAINSSVKALQEKIGDNIFSSELNLLYRSKIYGEEAAEVREEISKIAARIDIVLSRNQRELIKEISQLLDQPDEGPEAPLADVEYSSAD